MSTVSGGVAQAAAQAAAAEEGKKGKQYEDFYRFQQRDKRRSGEGARVGGWVVGAWRGGCGEGRGKAGSYWWGLSGG